MSENSIRPVTVGRRNWLFCDSTDGADASMMVYSLLETARANENMSDEELENMAPWSPKSGDAALINHKRLENSGDFPDFFKLYTLLFCGYG